MVKLRLMGLREELRGIVESLQAMYKVLSVSDFYPCRNSEYVRVYVEVTAQCKY